jgi:transposase
MLGLEPSMRYYLCQGMTDMRKGIDTLGEQVRKKMEMNPRNGDVFIFMSKNRRHIKILRYEHGGFILYWKRLDEGSRYLRPVFNSLHESYEIDWNNLVVLLEGTVRKELLVG